MTDATNQTEPPEIPIYRSKSEDGFYFVDEEGTPYRATIEGEPVMGLPYDAILLTPQDGETRDEQLAAERKIVRALSDDNGRLAAELSRLQAENEREKAEADRLRAGYAQVSAEAGRLSAALAQARRDLEESKGLATLEVDGDTGPWYVRLLHEPVARISESGCLVHIDWARDGRMIGVEILPDQAATPSDLQVPPSLGANQTGTRERPWTGHYPEISEAEATRRSEELTRPAGAGDTARAALAELAELVRLKDGPRDEGYRTAKDAAWNRARAIAAQPGDTAQPAFDTLAAASEVGSESGARKEQ